MPVVRFSDQGAGGDGNYVPMDPNTSQASNGDVYVQSTAPYDPGSSPGVWSNGGSWNPTWSQASQTAPAAAPASGGGGYAPASGSAGGYTSNGVDYGNNTIPAPSIAPPPVHHDAAWWKDNGALTDSTYVNQKAALLDKLNSYEQNVANQIGGNNLTQKTDADHNLVGSYWAGNALGKLYNPNTGHDGDITYDSTNALGGTLGTNFNTALSNFNNQQTQGYRNLAEDFAARGMLGGQQQLANGQSANGSGVWENQRANLNNQYDQQLNNLNTSAVQQYNDLLSSLAQQNSSAQTTLNGYLGDAANRLAAADAAGLPTS